MEMDIRPGGGGMAQVAVAREVIGRLFQYVAVLTQFPRTGKLACRMAVNALELTMFADQRIEGMLCTRAAGVEVNHARVDRNKGGGGSRGSSEPGGRNQAGL